MTADRAGAHVAGILRSIDIASSSAVHQYAHLVGGPLEGTTTTVMSDWHTLNLPARGFGQVAYHRTKDARHTLVGATVRFEAALHTEAN